MWLVRCKNKFNKSIDPPMVVAHPDATEFYEEANFMQAMGHPPLVHLNSHKDAVIPWNDFPCLKSATKNILMDAYSSIFFQKDGINIGFKRDNALEIKNEKQRETLEDWCQGYSYAQDGNLVWAAWKDKAQLLKFMRGLLSGDIVNHVLLPMVDLHTTAGYTGYYKTDLVVQQDVNHIRLDCARNLSFWAECFFPTE